MQWWWPRSHILHRQSSRRPWAWRAFSADVAPGVSRALVRNVTERSLVGPFGFPFGLDLLRRLFLVNIAIFGNGLALGVSRPSQERDYGCGGENSHADTSGCLVGGDGFEPPTLSV